MDSIEKNKLNLMGPYSIDKNMQVKNPIEEYQSSDFVDWIVQQGSYGDAHSLNYLGSSYMQGNGKMERNYEKAAQLFEKALELDDLNASANYNLGLMHMLGLIGNAEGHKDIVLAMEYFDKISDIDASAMNAIGVLYFQAPDFL
jgi:TPR repeat protein